MAKQSVVPSRGCSVSDSDSSSSSDSEDEEEGRPVVRRASKDSSRFHAVRAPQPLGRVRDTHTEREGEGDTARRHRAAVRETAGASDSDSEDDEQWEPSSPAGRKASKDSSSDSSDSSDDA